MSVTAKLPQGSAKKKRPGPRLVSAALPPRLCAAPPGAPEGSLHWVLRDEDGEEEFRVWAWVPPDDDHGLWHFDHGYLVSADDVTDLGWRYYAAAQVPRL